MDSPLISIVIPVYNEDESLRELAGEIHSVATANRYDYQIVFVDDGSTDRSWMEIERLARDNVRVGGIRFRRNFGKAAALMAGFAAAQGDIVFMMDADLQDPPAEMPHLLARLSEGYDLVSGWKQKRHDPWHKVYPSHVFNRLIGWMTGVHLHDHVCGLKVMRGEVAKSVRIYGEFHRFIAVFAHWRGFRVTQIATMHRARTHGVSKYGFTRFYKGFLDLLTIWFLGRYRWRPQHVIGMTGLVMSSVLFVLWVVMGLVFDARGVLLIATLTALAMPAVALISIGLLTQFVLERRPLEGLYDIVERVGWCEEAAPSPQPAATNGGENP